MSEATSTIAGLDAKRVGVVTPPANPTVEPELRALLPLDCAMYATRLPVFPGDLQARNARYAGAYLDAMASYGDLRLDAIYVGMTGASYPLGAHGDRALVERLRERAGVPVWTASRAIAEALAALEVSKIVLVSPYPPWLTELAVRYWKDAGIEIAQLVDFGEVFRAYRMTDAEVADGLARVQPPPGSAVVLSGTGMMSLRVIAAAQARVPVPIVSSNLCGAWCVMRALAMAPTNAMREASPSLARLLKR